MPRKNDSKALKIANQINFEIKNTIINRMEELSLTHEQLAEKMKKSSSNVSVLLTQDNILSIPTIVEFCLALGIDIAVLFGKRTSRVKIVKKREQGV